MEYIEREAAFNAVLKLIPKVDDDGYCWVIRGDAATAIDSIPAADVRPVVLCKDCKWWRGEGTICKGIGIDFGADGFCCEGERKDGADMGEES